VKKPKIRELCEALRSFFSRPFTTTFPLTAHEPAKKFRGKPEYNEDTCVGCGACFQVCPSKAIDMVDEIKDGLGRRILIHHPKDCLFCGECERNCITGDGIKLSRIFDIAYFDEKDVQDRIEHELLLCKHCGQVIGAVKHLTWIRKKLGNLAFSQPVLISRFTGEIRLATGAEESFSGETDRTDILKTVCPGCRRLAFISDEGGER